MTSWRNILSWKTVFNPQPGDKVVVVSKSYGNPMRLSMVIMEARARGQDYLYLSKIESRSDGEVYICNYTPNNLTGDFFMKEDLRPFEWITGG
jgi:hypothetical protein